MKDPFTTKADTLLTQNCIARIDSHTYQINSKSNPNGKSYIIDVNYLNDHKGECLGYRFYQTCNHIKRLKKAGVEIDEN